MSALYVRVQEPLVTGRIYMLDPEDGNRLVQFEPRPESWASVLGRQTANVIMMIVVYLLLKWSGVLVTVHVAVQS